MADALFELLAPYLDPEHPSPSPSSRDPQTINYLTRLTTLSLPDLTANEPASLAQSAQSHLRNLQALSKRSHKAVITSTSHLTSLSSLLPTLNSQTQTLSDGLPGLETAAAEFAQKYDRGTENNILDRRKKAMLLSENADRVTDMLDLPSLLSSTISAAQVGGTGASSGGTATSYSSALDLQGHIKRLVALFPRSSLIGSVAAQSETEIQNLASILIAALQSPSLKLAAAMRTIGWLRRVAPELVEEPAASTRPTSTRSLGLTSKPASDDGALGSLFLLCRLRTLYQTLEALDPLRELADQETTQRLRLSSSQGKPMSSVPNPGGGQSERYLKRYVEILREQAFNILSMYRSIFPNDTPAVERPAGEDAKDRDDRGCDPLLPLPSPVSSLALHLVDMLTERLREYMPNIRDKSARESLLTQVLYCAGSLGRLGADFGMAIASLEEDLRDRHGPQDAELDDQAQPEWAQVMKKHRVQASRLEVLARGVGTGKKGGLDVTSPLSPSPPTSAA